MNLQFHVLFRNSKGMINNYHVEYFICTTVTKQVTLNLQSMEIVYLATKMLVSTSQRTYVVSPLQM